MRWSRDPRLGRQLRHEARDRTPVRGRAAALTHGFAYAFAGGAIFAFIGAILAFVLISSDDSKQIGQRGRARGSADARVTNQH